jgi:hypothetical protein
MISSQQLAAAEEGVTRIVDNWDGDIDVPAGAVEVRVREERTQRGQWVGTYSAQDAETVATRIADMTGGTIGHWYVDGVATKALITVGGLLMDAQRRLESANAAQDEATRDRDAAIRTMLADAEKRDGTVDRIMTITGLSRARVYQIKDGTR